MGDTDWDVAVVGSGIAGMSAARVVADHGLRVIAYDRMAPGGQLINLTTVHEYPGLGGTSGPDLMSALLDEATAAGVELGYGEVTRVHAGAPLLLDTADGQVSAGAVVVATGLGTGWLGLPGEEALTGRGISTCAGCDGPLFTAKHIAVVGADEWTAQEALELAGFASAVTVLVPDEPGWSALRGEQLADNDRIEVRRGATVTALTGDGSLRGVVVRQDGGESELAVGGLFAYVGRRGEPELLEGAVPADEEGRLSADVGLGTAIPGVFVAGDIRAGAVPWLVAAAADGIRAGLAAVTFVRSRS